MRWYQSSSWVPQIGIRAYIYHHWFSCQSQSYNCLSSFRRPHETHSISWGLPLHLDHIPMPYSSWISATHWLCQLVLQCLSTLETCIIQCICQDVWKEPSSCRNLPQSCYYFWSPIVSSSCPPFWQNSSTWISYLRPIGSHPWVPSR